MESIEIKASKRDALGRRSATDLRKSESVPGVLYGGSEPVHFSALESEFKKIIFTPNIYKVILDVEGTKYTCILQDTQFHPTTDKLIHADFLAVSENKPVSVKLPVKLTGVSEGVKQGGKLVTKMRNLRVKGLIKDMPEVLEVSISELGLGQSIKIEKLSFPKLQILEAKNAIVCVVKATRGSIKEQPAAAAKK